LTGVKYQTTVDSFPTILQEKARETSNRRGSKCTLFVRPSKRSIIRYMKFLKLMKTKAEQATAARIEACSCFRNLFTFITANSIMSSKTLPHLMLNMDATQFRVGGTAADKVEVVVVKGANETNLNLILQRPTSVILSQDQANAAAKQKREATKMLKATPERPSKKSRRDEPLISPSQSEDKNIHEDDEEPEAMDLSEIRCSLWIM
jgi:hypothetical protein